MKALNFILILIAATVITNCNRKSNSDSREVGVTELTMTEEVDDISPPPPPGFISPFKTLEEWLDNICTNEKPANPIATFEFGFFEGPDNYTLYLVGMNRYDKTENHTVIRVEYEPTHMYFPLPANEYKISERQQVVEKLTSQLKDFIGTAKFKNCFLAKAKTITTSFKGEIWSQ